MTPNGLNRLHAVLRRNDINTRAKCKIHLGHGVYAEQVVPCVVLMDSRLDTENGTYTVTLRVEFSIESPPGSDSKLGQFVFPTAAPFLKAIRALDRQVFPRKERVDS